MYCLRCIKHKRVTLNSETRKLLQPLKLMFRQQGINRKQSTNTYWSSTVL